MSFQLLQTALIGLRYVVIFVISVCCAVLALMLEHTQTDRQTVVLLFYWCHWEVSDVLQVSVTAGVGSNWKHSHGQFPFNSRFMLAMWLDVSRTLDMGTAAQNDIPLGVRVEYSPFPEILEFSS